MDKKITSAQKVAGGVLGLAAGASAVTAGFYFFGKDGKGHRKQALAWSKKAKMEILEKIKDMKIVTKSTYQNALDDVLEKYKDLKSIDPKDLKAFGQELMSHWEKISKDAVKLTGKAAVKKSEAKI
jgi:hypothetical protein